jgi:hypothetical protein
LLAGTLALGCKLTSAGPIVDRIQSIDVSPARFALLPSQSADLTIIVLTSHGDTGGTASLQWTTTGGVITNNYLVGGVRRITYQAPVQAGTYLLVVTTANGWPADTAHFTITTTPVSVNAVAVTPESVSRAVDDTLTLRATLTDSSGNVLVGRAITWSTSDAAVATVLATGFVRAMAAGTATITATNEGHSGTSVVTVN